MSRNAATGPLRPRSSSAPSGSSATWGSISRAVARLTRIVPGAALSAVLYDVIGGATFLPLGMTWERGLTVFGLIFAMCAAAGLLAMRKLRDADPADMF